MKKTLSTWEAADMLYNDENANWSRAGSLALAEHLEEYEESTGEDIELDVVAIRCDFAEYDSLLDWADDYGADLYESPECDDKRDEMIKEYIQDRGFLIEFNGGIIVSSF